MTHRGISTKRKRVFPGTKPFCRKTDAGRPRGLKRHAIAYHGP